MYKIRRAIIMAAGQGKRMRPVTLETPKPLIQVHGVRIIDTAIQGLLNYGITEIYVVVGYMSEKFKVLEDEYDGLKLIVNPCYGTCNNISSLYAARDFIRESIILDGDQIIYNTNVLSPEFERSGYNCVWCEGDTKEWLLTVKNSIIQSCSREGGRCGWQLFGISRWTAEDGEKLKSHLEIEFEKKNNRQIYWDDIVLFCYPNAYHLGIRPMEYGDVVEVDDLDELIMIDKRYLKYTVGGLGQ